MRYDYFGEIGESNSSYKHTLSHEVGHWLNLSHTWGGSNSPTDANNCSIDDGVTDTPNTIGWSSCNLSGTTCDGNLDNVQNIMEYSYCSTMFTQGQVDRMHACLNNNTADRDNLWTSTNLAATGVNVAPTSICQVDMQSSTTVICAGSTIDFSDLSYYGVTARSWTFESGTPATSTDSSLTVTYNTAGTFSVNLQITDGTNVQSEMFSNYITVLPNPGVALPYSEGFESVSVPDNANFFVENQDLENTWEVTSSTNNGGDNCLQLNNFGMDAGSSDIFTSGPIDLSILDASENLLLTFDYAYNKKTSSDDEWLKIYVSSDCGETWNLRKNIHGNTLGSDVSTSSYTPTNETEWETVTISNITDSYYVSNFRYKFEFIGDGGNNIYIDNINLYPESWLNTTDLSIENTIDIFPNPTTGVSTLNYYSYGSSQANIELFNVVGEKVNTIYQGEISAGMNTYEIDLNELPIGIYMIRISDENGVQTKKLIKQ